MAKLESKARNLLVNLILYPDPNSYEWMTYKIKVCSRAKEDGIEEKVLLELSQEGLYFEECYVKEVKILCNGIKDVLEGEKFSFSFEPIDQGEFKFGIKNVEGEFFVDVYSEYFKVLETYEWSLRSYLGIKMEVKKEDFMDFVKQLESEYEEIESKFPGKTFLPKSKK